jgi:hypothetical protein
MLTTRPTLRALVAAALLALTMSSPALAQQDLRSPDTRDAALAATRTQDLRSPDARDAARAGEIARMMRRFNAAHRPPPVTRPAQRPVVVSEDGSPWLPIALMGAFSLAVVAASAVYVRRVRRRTFGVAS